MKLAALIRRMSDAGAPPEAIAIAVEAIEAAQDRDAQRRARQAERKRRSRDNDGTVPGPSDDMAGTERDNHGTVPGQSGDAAVTGRDTPSSPPSPSSSPPIPSLITTPPSPSPPVSVSRAGGDWPDDAFSQFWAAYPNKIGKPEAERVFHRIRKGGKVRWVDLQAGLRRYAGKTDDRPWCNPATWLNQGRWEDQPAMSGNRTNGTRPDRNGKHRGSGSDFFAGLASLVADLPGHRADGPGREEIPPGRFNIDA